MPKRPHSVFCLAILDVFKHYPGKPVMIRETETCKDLLSSLGLVNNFPCSDESGFSAAIFEHERHYLIAARWLEHPEDEKGVYQMFCAPKAETTRKEAMEILKHLQFFNERH
jgi:hypothetical protein